MAEYGDIHSKNADWFLSSGWWGERLAQHPERSGCWHLFSKLRTAVYPWNKARISAKLWENAFQTICNFSFFDAENNFGWFISKIWFFFQRSGVLEDLWISERYWQIRVKSYCPKWVYFWGDFLGGGVNNSICVETFDLAPKLTSTIWCCDLVIL